MDLHSGRGCYEECAELPVRASERNTVGERHVREAGLLDLLTQLASVKAVVTTKALAMK